MYEEYRKDVLLELSKVLGDNSEAMMLALIAVDKASHKYEITQKTYDLVPLSNVSDEYLRLYLASLSIEGKSNGTLKNRYYAIKNFFAHVQRPIEDVTTNDIRSYLYKIKDDSSETNEEKTRQRLFAFFSFCVDEGLLQTNPCARIRAIKTPKAQIKPLSDNELQILFDSGTTKYELALVSFLYSTGARIAEAAYVKVKDLDFDAHRVRLFGKGKKERFANLSDSAMENIKEYLLIRNSDSPYLFKGKRKDDGVTSHALRRTIQQIAKRGGITVNPHQIRHTTATNLQKTMPIQQISKYLGHANITTTMVYADINREEMDNNFNLAMNKKGTLHKC